MSQRADSLRDQMSPEEKAHFVAGHDMWHTGAIERLGEDLDRALYVGDHLVDAQAAEALGVDFVGVLTGCATRETFAAHPALAIIEDVSGIADVLASR